jgi:hypothetical protein
MQFLEIEDVRPVWDKFVNSFRTELNALCNQIDMNNNVKAKRIQLLLNNYLKCYNAHIIFGKGNAVINFSSAKDCNWFLLKWS